MERPETSNSTGDLGDGASVVQAHRIDQVTQHFHPPGAPAAEAVERDPWVEAASCSGIWRHVPQGRDIEPFRRAAAEFVGALAQLRDEAEVRLAADPWLDAGVALRFHGRLTELLGAPGQAEDLDLYPAEAALLVFTPFLFRVYELRRAVARVELGPAALSPAESPSPARVSYEAFASEYRSLTERVLRRGQDEAAVGWWLYHRWLLKAENSAGVDDLWGLAPELFHRLWKPDRVRHLLHGLRLGPGVCNPEHLEGLWEDEYFPIEGQQHLRERQLALLLALGFGMSLEASSLSDTVVEHLGIPHPVDPSELQRTVTRARWGSDRHLLTLHAECHHEAVIEGLREHVHRVDELLHAIHRTLRAHVANLPSRLSSDRVEPVEDAFEGWARFRIDERRARELLTGEQLYKNKDLAVRELYQNALDACRYRRARTEYLDRTSLASYAYEGGIEFTQGVDAEGRSYVDCVDNGVGMGESELRGVFSHAGSRFAEQPDYLQERERWERQDPPVRLYPNSRFGIGVLSYFMLADEIRVTTCRMRADGTLGPELEAMIHGPGHLFRVVRTGRERRVPGTRVRLYLKERVLRGEGDGTGNPWSCVRALGAVLGVAEFDTVADDGSETTAWTAGKPNISRLVNGFRSRSTERTVSWASAPEDTDVAWCAEDGALLVDGLLVDSPFGRAVRIQVSSPAPPFGIMINLCGPYAPVRLSADRTRVLDDVLGVVRPLLAGAVGVLHGGDCEFLNDAWLASLAQRAPELGDIVVASVEASARTAGAEAGCTRISQVGYTPADGWLARSALGDSIGPYLGFSSSDGFSGWSGRAADRFCLWRALASAPEAVVAELYGLCPTLAPRTVLRPALPTDQALLLGSVSQFNWSFRDSLEQGALYGLPPRTVVDRWKGLGLLGSELRVAVTEVANVNDALLRLLSEGQIALEGAPDYDTVIGVAQRLEVDPAASVEFLNSHGAPVPDGVRILATAPEAEAIRGVLARWGDAPFGSPLGRIEEYSLRHLCQESGFSPEEMGDHLVASGARDLAQEVFFAEIRRLCSHRRLSTEEFVREAAGIGRFVSESDFSLGFFLTSPYEEGLSGWERGERLEACGVDLPNPPSREALQRLLELLDGVRSLPTWRSRPLGAPLPFALALSASQGVAPELDHLLGALDEHGITFTRHRLPTGLDRLSALQLIFYRPNQASTLFLGDRNPLSLAAVIAGAYRVDASLEQTAEWYRGLGYEVPDLAQMVREAAPYVPLRERRSF